VAFFSFLSPLEMPLTPEKLQQRTKRFAPNVFEFCDELPSKPSCWVVRKQLLRSASSVAANYRAACRAVSKKAFVAKLAIVEEEADESLFWLEMLEEMDVGNPSKVQKLKSEADQLVAITVASKKTSRQKGKQ
jgi:four helix bundle protein